MEAIKRRQLNLEIPQLNQLGNSSVARLTPSVIQTTYRPSNSELTKKEKAYC